MRRRCVNGQHPISERKKKGSKKAESRKKRIEKVCPNGSKRRVEKRRTSSPDRQESSPDQRTVLVSAWISSLRTALRSETFAHMRSVAARSCRMSATIRSSIRSTWKPGWWTELFEWGQAGLFTGVKRRPFGWKPSFFPNDSRARTFRSPGDAVSVFFSRPD